MWRGGFRDLSYNLIAQFYFQTKRIMSASTQNRAYIARPVAGVGAVLRCLTCSFPAAEDHREGKLFALDNFR